MKAPTVHLNGTSGQTLLDNAIAAKDAVEAARTALRAAYPNGRDYYVQDVSAAAGVSHRIAVDEFVTMDRRLGSVIAELEELAFAIAQQIS